MVISDLRQRSIAASIQALLGHLGRRRRSQLVWLSFLMVAASIAEVLSIGAVVPFLTVLTAPDRLQDYALTRDVLAHIGTGSPSDALMPITAMFVVAVLFAGSMRLLLAWASTRYAFAVGTELSCEVYRRTLYQPLAQHISRNSSEVITGVVTKVTMVINNTLLPILTLASSILMFVAVLLALAAVDIWVSLGSFIGFGSLYFGIAVVTRSRKVSNGQRIAHESARVVKTLQEGLGGIREILIDGSQATYCNAYSSSDIPLRRAQGSNQFLAIGPRYVVEALGMTVIAVVAWYVASQSNGSLASAVPTLGALAVGAQRLLPLLQQSYAAWSSILGGQASLQDTLILLDQPAPDAEALAPVEALSYRHEIRLQAVSFRYSDDLPWVLRDVSFSISKGDRIGVIGTTGSGKSTLLDILMGLLDPVDGSLVIDGRPVAASDRRAWQRHIAHVPQSVFLCDDSIEANIAFGVPAVERDPQRVRLAAHKAQLTEVIESWPDGYSTRVGERGVRLSGGQRQRIGLARAFYKQANVIVLDEATSALDDETELAVMKSIESLSTETTVVMIAHRLTTLRTCSQIIELKEGRIVRAGSFEQIVLSSPQKVAV